MENIITALIIIGMGIGACWFIRGVSYTYRQRGLAGLMRDELNYGRVGPMASYN